jgi:hypothetical protein
MMMANVRTQITVDYDEEKLCETYSIAAVLPFVHMVIAWHESFLLDDGPRSHNHKHNCGQRTA